MFERVGQKQLSIDALPHIRDGDTILSAYRRGKVLTEHCGESNAL